MVRRHDPGLVVVGMSCQWGRVALRVRYSPHRGVGRRPKPVRIRHSIPPALALRRVSTDLILGAPAPTPAHHDILQGFSSSCLSIRAQVRGLPFDWFLRNPAGGVSPRVTSCSPPTLSPPPWARRRVSTDLILGAPAPSPAHHDILRGFSSSCLSIPAQVRELPFAWFLRNPAGGVSPRVTSCSPLRRHRHPWPVGGCPRTSSWERRRPRRPITTYCEASHRHACRLGRKCGGSHLIGSCETLPAGAHALPGGLTTGHFVLAPTPSPPPSASVQSRADRERRAGMPVDQYLSVLG